MSKHMNHWVTVIIIKYILTSKQNKKKYRRNFYNGKYKDTRKYLAKLDWNNMLRKKTAFEYWNIKKYEIESIIEKFFSLKQNKENGRERNTSQKKLLEK